MSCKTLQGKYAEKLEERIDKAIEYIKQQEDYFNNYPLIDKKYLLEILEGKDDRE